MSQSAFAVPAPAPASAWRQTPVRHLDIPAVPARDRRLEEILQWLPAGVVVLDPRGVVVQCNPAAVALLGEPLEGARWRDVIARSFAPRSDDGHEVSLRDGRRISIATRSLESEPGQLLLLTDLTETRRLQEHLSRHQRLSALGRMMSSLAHQIRTPLSAALLYASHLRDGTLSREQSQRFAGKIVDRLNHLEDQVRDMLIFARGDVKLTEIATAATLLQQWRAAMEAPLAAAGARCQIELAAPKTPLACNLQVLVGALMNLVNNSLQAAGAGARLRIVLEECGDALVISVEDSGPGFDAATAVHLQDDFFSTKPQGTGLGLAVARAVARAHHGEFFIESTPGAGTRAGMRLPVHRVDTRQEVVA